MELVVLGSSGSGSGPGNPASGYLLRADGRGMVLDLGPGSFGELYAVADPQELAAVCLTHLHPDHCLDAVALHVACHYGPWSLRDLPLYCPPGGVARLIRAEQAVEGESVALAQTFRECPWQDEQVIGPWLVRTAPMAHPVPAVGLRVEHDGRSLVYSGDTGPCAELVELARGADVLLAEAGFGVRTDGPAGLHLSGFDAGEIAEAAGVGELIVTHVPAWADVDRTVAAARSRFSGRVSWAAPGASFPVGSAP